MPHALIVILISISVGGGFKGIVLGVSLTHWPSLTRVIRAEIMQIRESDYVKISKKFGKSNLYIAIEHIIPHIIPQLLIGIEPILSVKDLGISFSQYTKGLRRRELEVITNLDIDLYEGEILAVVGSSGSGKSLLAHAILGILPDNATTEGNIIYKGKTLTLKVKERYLISTDLIKKLIIFIHLNYQEVWLEKFFYQLH